MGAKFQGPPSHSSHQYGGHSGLLKLAHLRAGHRGLAPGTLWPRNTDEPSGAGRAPADNKARSRCGRVQEDLVPQVQSALAPRPPGPPGAWSSFPRVRRGSWAPGAHTLLALSRITCQQTWGPLMRTTWREGFC